MKKRGNSQEEDLLVETNLGWSAINLIYSKVILKQPEARSAKASPDEAIAMARRAAGVVGLVAQVVRARH